MLETRLDLLPSLSSQRRSLAPVARYLEAGSGIDNPGRPFAGGEVGVRAQDPECILAGWGGAANKRG